MKLATTNRRIGFLAAAFLILLAAALGRAVWLQVIKGPQYTAMALRQHRETVVVPDVEAFPGHIACDAASRSEIVVPILVEGGGLYGVLDLDSPLYGRFDDEDRAGLERLVRRFVTATDLRAEGA